MNQVIKSQTPLPHDIALQLPLPEWLLIFILILSFLVHILFVNLMLGGSLITLWYQIKGLKVKEYDQLANELAKTITVNKSLAVVMGIAPLLTINTLYTIYFYTANSLTGFMWIAVIPLVTIAFLLTYLHKYTWTTLDNHKALHICILAVACLIFLFIPLIFLVNINLMLFPEKWAAVQGFISALVLPNVFPRYLHFILASLAVTGLFIFWYFGRNSYKFDSKFKVISQYSVRRGAYTLTFVVSMIQFLIGPIVLLTLPSKGVGWNLVFVILTGAVFALPAMYWMFKAITGKEDQMDKSFLKVVAFFSLTVIFMVSGRHIYRSNALGPHQRMMAAKTKIFLKASKEARQAAKVDYLSQEKDNQTKGEMLFAKNCSVCHHLDNRLVGPPITEMISIYRDNTKELIDWIKKPGRKRMDGPPMPVPVNLTDEDRKDLARFILSKQ